MADPAGAPGRDWHATEVAAVYTATGSHPLGLTPAAASARLQSTGPNRLPPPARRGPWRRLGGQLHNTLIYVLLAAATITALLRHWLDAGVIFGVVVINAVIGFLQEGKAERALDAVRQLLSANAIVIRGGERLTVPAEQVVPGDLIVVQSGDKVPADARLCQVRELRADEAMLTGESEPVVKSVALVAAETVLGDRDNMVYAGTLITFGQGTGIVVATGQQTEIGRISALLAHIEPITTPMLQQIDRFGRTLTGVILLVAGALLLFGTLVREYPLSEMFLAAVGIAVAAIPEGLPAIITITLAIGVQRMARRNAIVRRLPAVETLGSVTTICSDKTGTLTCNEMTVQRIAVAGPPPIVVSGTGYAPTGGLPPAAVAETAGAVDKLCRAGALCNDARLVEHDGNWRVIGDPTEGALLVLAAKAGIDAARLAAEQPRTDAIPFESAHQFMATLHHDHGGHAFLYAKGAPETMIERCTRQCRAVGGVEPLDTTLWHERIAEFGADGLRPLALAMKSTSVSRTSVRFDDVRDLVLLGVVGIADPPRADAVAAIARCRAAGIEVKMITGDHVETARAIATRMGLTDGKINAVTGIQLDTLDDAQLMTVARETSVFARTSPEHKLRLVCALQAAGEVVAMTGDGVNDAPALKRADIGVAMGIKGSDVAKETAGMVLADDNFTSIAQAVEEGRTVYDNVKKSILYTLPTSVGEALMILLAIAFGQSLPVTPVQILWINMITEVTLGLAFAFEPAAFDVMQRPPRRRTEPLLTAFMVWRIVFVSLLMVLATFGLFLWERMHGAELNAARTVAVNMLVIAEVVYLFNTRALTTSALSWRALTDNRVALIAVAVVLGLQLLFTGAPFMHRFFASDAIPLESWVRIAIAGLGIFLLVEVEKWIGRRADARNR